MPDSLGVQVLDAMGWQPTSIEQLALRTGLAVVQLVVALDQLQRDGWVAGGGGWVYLRGDRQDPDALGVMELR